MDTKKYLYIDDEEDKVVQGIVKNLSSKNLTVEAVRARSWDTEIDELIDHKKLNEYDGLLVDLQLKFAINDKEKIKYLGPDLVQAIRSKIKSRDILDLPILLCSSESNWRDLLDETSINLFDKKYSKVTHLSKTSTSTELESFANAYKVLNYTDKLQDILQYDGELFELELNFKDLATSHEKSRLIYDQIILVPGLLIDEDLLAIRLGIDRDKSEDWEKLKSEVLIKFKYEGILCEFNNRWWQADLTKWWKDTFNQSLQVLSAIERVALIKDKFNLSGIKELKLPANHKYDTFWYKCRLTNTPVESADALKTIEMPKYYWQEHTYISLNYIWSEDRDVPAIRSLLGSYESEKFDSIIERQRSS